MAGNLWAAANADQYTMKVHRGKSEAVPFGAGFAIVEAETKFHGIITEYSDETDSGNTRLHY